VARTRTLTNLIADCRRLAKMENSTFCTDADITEMLNQELAELQSRLGQVQGQPLYRSSATIPVTSGTSSYSLTTYAPDLHMLQGVEATIAGQTVVLQPFMPIEHGVLSSDGTSAFGVFYRLQGNSIEFLPDSESFTATIYYTPTQTRLVNAGDTFDGFNGYEMAAIYGTVAQMLAMEESDPSFWEGRRERIYRHIEAIAAQRDASMPERVQDVTWAEGDWLI
jgi:hypothetical protein